MYRSLFFILAYFALVFALVLAIGIVQDKSYLASLKFQSNPDAIHYAQLAENIATLGVYSRHPDAMGEPDILRTPVYPLFIIASGGLVHPAFLFVAQAILILGSVALTYRLGKRTIDSHSGILAAFLLATDILIVVSCFEAMSEILFLFLTLLALDILDWPSPAKQRQNSNLRVFMGGVMVGISTLARPSNLYLPVILITGQVFSLGRRATIQGLLRYSLLLLIGASIPVVPWIIRNQQAVGVAKLTNVDKHNLVYFVGAGTLQARHGWDRVTAQQYLERKYNLPSYSELQNPWLNREKTTKELYETVAPLAFSIATDDPLMLVKASTIGIIKASLAHSAGAMSRLLGGEWTSIRTYEKNANHLSFIFFAQMSHTTFSLVFCGIACVLILSGKYQQKALLCIPLVLAFYYLMIAMMGYDAVARARISCLPFIYVLAAFGLKSALHFVKIRESPQYISP